MYKYQQEYEDPKSSVGSQRWVRTIPVLKKIGLLTRVKNLDTVSIAEPRKYLRWVSDFKNNFVEIHKNNKIQFDLIKDKKLESVIKVMMKFILRVAWKMQKFLPLNDKLLNCVTALNPYKFSFESWKMLGHHFANIITEEEFEEYYKELEKYETNLPAMAKLFEEHKADIYAFYFSKTIQGPYPMLSKLAVGILSIPYSTTDLEKSFSHLKLIKTPLRNSLKNETTEGLCLVKSEYNFLIFRTRLLWIG